MNNARNVTDLTEFTYEDCKVRFDTDHAAKIYSKRHLTSRKGKQEQVCIQKALADLPKNTLVLDLPCGTGRLTFFIKNLGFRVVGADYSQHMIKYAKQQPLFIPELKHTLSFEQQDVMAITHADRSFGATVCNRLFHHYGTSALRQRALKELSRVTDGPIIVSFFNSHSLGAQWRRLLNFVRRRKPLDRVPIPFSVFKKDVEASGLKVQAVFYPRYLFSPQTYLKLSK
ncbi:MAG: class I SAM-dependent methyltransferase [Gammaproteobacteria bacterium]|nr:class I SAM-dependent methyltransferase [Gammaproteobacteria bacterium]